MIRRLRQACLLGGAIVLPLFVSAHNGEWLLAKLTIGPDGGLTLRVTADAEANFHISDEASLAREAKELLLLDDGQETRPWADLAPAPRFDRTDRLDPEAPLGHAPEELARRYNLLQATWRWPDPPARFTLRVPEKSPHTVILWLVDERRPKGDPRWVMLIGGDESPLIATSDKPARRESARGPNPGLGMPTLVALASALVVLLAWCAFNLRRIGAWLDRRRRR